MQLPIASLNGVHVEEYHHNLDPVFSYYLSGEELEEIKIVSQDPKVRALLNIPDIFEEENKKVEMDSDLEMYQE